MKTKWLISNLGNDSDIQNLSYAVQETGRKCDILSLGQISELCDNPSNEFDCVVTRGSIWTNKNLKKSKPNWMGNFHNNDYFSCSNYYQYLKNWITQKNYCMILLGELLDSKDKIYEKFGKNDLVFIRPNSGEKEFNGELVHKNMFSNWKEMVKKSLSLSDDILCIVSEPVDIDKETRIVIVEGKAVTGSYYRVAKHIHREEVTGDEWEKCASFAEMVIGFLPNKPPFFVVDIATKSDTMSIMEIGCFCCAGLYECDVKKIAEAISVSAERFAKGKINDI